MNTKQVIETLNQAYFSADPDEAGILRNLQSLLRGSRSFLDLGASLGQFTKLASEVMTNADIVAVEADPVRFEQLEKNAATWAADSGNRIRAVHAAVSDRPGRVAFQVTNSTVSGGLFRHDLKHLEEDVRREVCWQEVEVDAVTLDGLFPQTPPDFIKMDIEARGVSRPAGGGIHSESGINKLVH